MEILVAFLLALGAIFSALWHYWPQITSWPESAAMFVGSLAGAGGGLFAILLGALYNAHLNRKRDCRLREQERATITSVVQAELVALRIRAKTRYLHIRKWRARATTVTATKMGLIGIPRQMFLESNAERLGLLGPKLTSDIVAAHAQASHIAMNLEAIRHGDPGAPVLDSALETFEDDFNNLVLFCGDAIDALERKTGQGFAFVWPPV